MMDADRTPVATPFQKIVRGRRSIRRFLDTPVDRDKVLICLEAARRAPSAHNAQPWRFLVIDDPDVKAGLAAAAFTGVYSASKFAARAPVIIILLAKLDFVADRLGSRLQGVPYHFVDLGIAGEHIALQAEELGLATCWVGWFHVRKLRKFLGIPKTLKIVAIMPLGHAEKRPTREPPRRTLREIVSFNRLGSEEGPSHWPAED